MKNSFNRYYLFNIQSVSALVFCHILMLIVPLYRWLSDGKFSFALFLLFGIIMPLIIYLMYFGFGFYGVFQKVIINSEGIGIWLFKRCVKKYTWNSISKIENSHHMRNPALKITLQNDDVFYLERRKPIIQAIEFYSNKHVEGT